jgi:hypothetical protein
MQLDKLLFFFFQATQQMMSVMNTPAKKRPTAIPATPPSDMPEEAWNGQQRGRNDVVEYITNPFLQLMLWR